MNNKGVARAAKELRRQQAEERNAQTPDERRRCNRDGDAADRAALDRMLAVAVPVARAAKVAVPARKRPTVLPVVRVPGEPITKPGDRKRPTVRTAPPPPRVHVAPRRITDGLRPNHAARAVALGGVFPPTDLPAAVPAEAVET